MNELKRHIDTDRAIHNIVTLLTDTNAHILSTNLESRLKEIAKDAQRNCCWELLDRFEDTPVQEIPIINEYLSELSDKEGSNL